MKIGRNDPCPCGSGKKYKKCCIPKYDQPVKLAAKPKIYAKNILRSWEEDDLLDTSFLAGLWTPQKVRQMSDQEILEKLHELKINLTREQFIQDIERQCDTDLIIAEWQTRYSYEAKGWDEDFPFLALRELWDRWTPDYFGIHRIDEMAEEMEESHSDESQLRQLENIWKVIKDHVILPYGIHSFHAIHSRFVLFYDLESLFFDYESELIAECRVDLEKQEEHFAKLIALYEDILLTLSDIPLQNRLNIQNFIAQAYFYMGNIEKGEVLYQQLTDGNPTWAWGYVSWGDMYNFTGSFPNLLNKEKAEDIYRRGLQFCKSEDRDVLRERIKDLK